MTICEVLCCRSSLDPNRTYHKFPNDTARCKEWLKILGKKSTDLKPKSVVCSRHFRFKDYYSGGKRLLPSAIPVLRLSSNSPKKEKSVPLKVRKSEPKKQKNVNSQSPARLRKSLPNIKSNQFKEVKQSPKLLKKPLKSNVPLDTSRSKQLVKKVSNAKSEKQEKENVLKSDSGKAVGRKHLKENKTSWKPLSKLSKRSPLSMRKNTLNRSPLSMRKNTLSRRRHSLLCKNNKKSPLKSKDVRTHAVSSSNKKGRSITKIEKCPIIQNTKQLPCKLEENEHVVKSKNVIGSEKIIIFKSPSDNFISETKARSLEQLNTTDKISLETEEIKSRTRRSVRKRKRLLSEDCFEIDDNGPKVQKVIVNKPKVQKYNKYSGVSKKELKQPQTSVCNTGNENLSGIEKTILEMQKKIQMLEKKAILDEMKIDTFKKALITQRNTDLQILMDEKENELLLRMDLLYLDYDPQRICRLCLQLMDKKEDLIPLFWPLKNQALLSLIRQATNVEVELEDGMPSSICGECLEDIKRVDWLKRRTQKSNILIKKFVTMKKSSTQNNTEISQVASDVKPKSDDTPSEEEITDEFKIEDVFSLENSPMSLFENITVKQEQEPDEESKLSHELNTTYSIAAKKRMKSRRCGNCTRKFKSPWELKVHSRYCSKRFQCSECNRCFLNAALFRRHKQKMYTCYCAENLRYCSDCNISFRWKWQLVFHVLRHSTQVCVLCNDTVHSEEHLVNHFTEAHPNYSNLHSKHFLSLI